MQSGLPYFRRQTFDQLTQINNGYVGEFFGDRETLSDNSAGRCAALCHIFFFY